ncbi:hypothetical protein LINPERPRIM_LOCUS21624 [Linum perenne]
MRYVPNKFKAQLKQVAIGFQKKGNSSSSSAVVLSNTAMICTAIPSTLMTVSAKYETPISVR